MQPMIWPILLLLLGVLFIVVELFVPSGGVLSFLAAGSVVAAVVVGFNNGLTYGAITLTVTMILVPTFILITIHYWPRTPIGRLIFLRRAEEDDVLPNDEEILRRKALVGKFGTAKSKMLPSGAVTIDGRVYDAVSRGHAIEAGETIRVVRVEGNRIVVAPADPQQAARAAQANSADDVLAQPIDSLGLESFDEPLA
jgi:membrane-bound ClpP family serine protease